MLPLLCCGQYRFVNWDLQDISGYLIFIGLLVVLLVYELSIGALDFGPNGKKILKAYKNRK